MLLLIHHHTISTPFVLGKQAVEETAEVVEARVIEHVGDLDLHPELGTEPVDDLDGLQDCPQLEEVVGGRHGGQPQDLLPDGADPVLGLAAQGQGFAARLVGGQQGFAIQLVGAGAGSWS